MSEKQKGPVAPTTQPPDKSSKSNCQCTYYCLLRQAPASAIIEVEARRQYASIDLDTCRDGGFSIPPEGWQRIHHLLRSARAKVWDYGKRGFYCHSVPLSRAESVAREIAKVVAEYRDCCDYHSFRSLWGLRAPLVSGADRYGRTILVTGSEEGGPLR